MGKGRKTKQSCCSSAPPSHFCGGSNDQPPKICVLFLTQFNAEKGERKAIVFSTKYLVGEGKLKNFATSKLMVFFPTLGK
jgi:hypothetical protein